MKLSKTFDRADINFIKPKQQDPTPEPVSVDDVVAVDKQPRKLKEIYGNKGMSWARVTAVDLAHGVRYARLNYLRQGDFTDFDCRTLAARIDDGSMVQASTLSEKLQIVQLIADSLQREHPEIAHKLTAIVQEV